MRYEVVRFEGNVVMNLDKLPAADAPDPSVSASATSETPAPPEPEAVHAGKTRSVSHRTANPK